MTGYVHPTIVGTNASRTLMQWTVEQGDRTEEAFSRVALDFSALLSGQRIARKAGSPNYADPHPTPGAAKVPEIVEGSIVRGVV